MFEDFEMLVEEFEEFLIDEGDTSDGSKVAVFGGFDYDALLLGSPTGELDAKIGIALYPGAFDPKGSVRLNDYDSIKAAIASVLYEAEDD